MKSVLSRKGRRVVRATARNATASTAVASGPRAVSSARIDRDYTTIVERPKRRLDSAASRAPNTRRATLVHGRFRDVDRGPSRARSTRLRMTRTGTQIPDTRHATEGTRRARPRVWHHDY